MDIKAILDADSMIYASAVNSGNISDAKNKLDARINESLNDLQDLGYDIMSLVVCSGSKGNFRKFISSSYKANRKDTELPHLLDELHEYCKSDWYAQWAYGIETDDLVAKIWHESNENNESPVIVSIDKDYLQFPAMIFNYNKKKLVKVTELEALKNFYTQMIVGDSADNIKVCKNKGKAYADKLFKDLTSKYLIVNSVYAFYIDLYKSISHLKYI